MSLPYPPSLSVPFAVDATAPYIRVVPVPSQIGIENGAASWRTGFVPLNMTLKTAGGVAPFGNDMNGVMNYISANLLWLMSGGNPVFNADIVSEWTGYPVGAVLVSAVDPSKFFYNTVADNANDPDSVTTGWIPFSPLSTPTELLSVAPAAGTYNDVAVGKNVGAVDVDTSAGNVIWTGITAGSDGQILTVTNTGANLLTLDSLNVGSAAANRFRFATDLSIPQNDSLTIRHLTSVGKWLKL